MHPEGEVQKADQQHKAASALWIMSSSHCTTQTEYWIEHAMKGHTGVNLVLPM